ncbi:hypothetical protein F5Y00DRAFT_65445 [Daldinia vernicosa]|uniref:uncharacterized protein n=1 Tax=Daldinia vernicosa TaxID=114800 RepID=UPI002008BEB1|nr:uncharacterized protein F5Y00DRAFT_65445 [Daldinia vernicosa]KAI0849345.1 hypothetical protein F5Y00DRAFT_65445 [Daldinia vernicosa]
MHKIKPLSHSRRALEDVIQPENGMRPFLAYSVPAPHPILDKFSNHPMEAIPWDSLEAQVSKIDEGLSVEASKVGASRVDHSYSLFNPLVDPTPWARPVHSYSLFNPLIENIIISLLILVCQQHQS